MAETLVVVLLTVVFLELLLAVDAVAAAGFDKHLSWLPLRIPTALLRAIVFTSNHCLLKNTFTFAVFFV